MNNYNTFDSIIIPLIQETDTIRLGHNLARILKCGDCITLSGEIGSGKTFLARSIIRFLLKNDNLEVVSPTFTLVQIYEDRIPIAHFDFYRLSNPQDFFELGFDEILSENICIVEWPEAGKELIPYDRICIQFERESIGIKATISAKRWIIEHLIYETNRTYKKTYQRI
ncbi:MAG: tRNA (adenosine(37)-N6)-threonylcarbamoyltransferase complex ATPase subunit type 1 TsaE [Candidatus Liberibacter europaeus]|uniref:tRNA threonylcarbamoyladenosine biosynthesis protein TsaE n=1 Tax=Candidatus Liberibacter europaeus TaxID=744859 RepID=A0A2T4VZ78_9HYPH|nr:tRNA (adenosine(37)-N6)-threonylcarbamoyltransferase complex ATPase subunit type 1 TsaE [Candidatus Liberibacter europaeus]PTL87089.1 MAG: tRNA (adenosine(37)-N6)-threonylcarbamoyltransferase complex ATPase subunit type 1 TsaE [Candidatus Liberibacter europaeus]